jgi:hypothetical protein
MIYHLGDNDLEVFEDAGENVGFGGHEEREGREVIRGDDSVLDE